MCQEESKGGEWVVAGKGGGLEAEKNTMKMKLKRTNLSN